jgi:hypothetical protein
VASQALPEEDATRGGPAFPPNPPDAFGATRWVAVTNVG